MEERGIAQIIDTRGFRVPESQSIRQLISFVIYHAIKIVKRRQCKTICIF